MNLKEPIIGAVERELAFANRQSDTNVDVIRIDGANNLDRDINVITTLVTFIDGEGIVGCWGQRVIQADLERSAAGSA